VPTETFLRLVREEQEQRGAFDPKQIAAMTTAFDRLLLDLKLVRRDDPIVLMVARLVIEMARLGERDPEALRKRVLAKRRPESN